MIEALTRADCEQLTDPVRREKCIAWIECEEKATEELERIGYAGDAKTFRERHETIERYRREGCGPGAWFDRWMRSLKRRAA